MKSCAQDPLRPLQVVTLACLLSLGLGACNRSPAPEMAGAGAGRIIDNDIAEQEWAADVPQQKTVSATPAHAGATASAAKGGSDVALSARVKSALHAEAGLKAPAIEVTAVNGEVTLYGTVNAPQRRERATQVALNVNGVKSVTNHLIILRGS